MSSRRKTKTRNCDKEEDSESCDDRAAFTKDPEMEKDFLELCFREVQRQGYKGMSLTKDSWTRNRGVRRQKVLTSSLSGKQYMTELLEGPSIVIYDEFRMDKQSFKNLCLYFRQKNWLCNSKHIDVEEKMAMFLSIVSHNNRNRIIRYRFQHSGQTVHKYFHEVLNAMMNFAQEMIVHPDFTNPTENIRSHIDLREGAFIGAVGALDGTLIDANIPIDEQVPFRGRGQGNCYQNVMVVCDFDMKFIYVMAGWEGIAHDSKVLNETLRDPANNFPIPPPSMYYLCDAAYINTRGFLSPYRNTRYWLRTYRGNSATNTKEKFNHAHAKLRNVIERSFSVLKKRFPILNKMPPYKFSVQRDIVIACMAIHNFLRRVSRRDELFEQAEQGEEDENDSNEMNYTMDESEPPSVPPSHGDIFSTESQMFMNNMRDQIANCL